MQSSAQTTPHIGSAPGDWSPKHLAVLVVLALFAFAVMGYHPGLEDDAFYLAAIKRDLNPALYPHDSEFFRLQFQATTFDRLIVGSSLSGNMNPRIFEDGFDLHKVRNASAFGAGLADRIAVAQLAIRKQPILKTIFFEIKSMNIEGACHRRSSRFPTYLFDKNPLNDLLYFLSADMVFMAKIKRSGLGDFFTTNPDQAARWLEAHAAHVASAPGRMNSLIAKVRDEAPRHPPIDIDARPMSDDTARLRRRCSFSIGVG